MSEYLDWKVGDRVICVDDSFRDPEDPRFEFIGDLDGLTVNKIYTLREIFVDVVDETVCVRLNEIVRSVDEYDGLEAGYQATRFCKLIDRPTDISIFEKMLTKTPEQNNKELVESELEELVNV